MSRTGSISTWQLELSTEEQLRQFDYATITDVVLHMSYTAREDGGLKRHAVTYLDKFLANRDDWTTQPLIQLFSMKHELPSEWYRFLHPAAAGGTQILSFTLGKDRLPFFVDDRDLVIEKIELFAKCTDATSYDAVLSFVDRDGNPVESGNLTMPQNPPTATSTR